jgi:protein-S-isoprenylcysteine O-methyltransferase Ste14
MNLELKVPPLIVMFFIMCLMYLVSVLFSSFNIDFLFQTFMSIETFVSGLVVSIAGIYILKDEETTISPLTPKNASKLVVNGIYKFTRNPMYLGMSIMLLAWLIFLGNSLNIFNIILYILYMNRYQIIPEEKVLEKLFGDEFLSYKLKVRRWL